MPFIVGVGRSGTTLLRLMIDAHPNIAIPPETQWLIAGLEKVDADKSPEDVLERIRRAASWSDMDIPDDAVEAIFDPDAEIEPDDRMRKIYETYAARYGAKRYGDKTPSHVLHMPLIARHFPEARFIHIIRDGRDVATSYRDLWFGPGKDAGDAATFWKDRILAARAIRAGLPHYMEVSYEGLIEDPETVLRKVGKFIGLPFHKAQLNAHSHAQERLVELKGRKLKTENGDTEIAADQVRDIHRFTSRPPDKSRVARWRREMDPADVARFEEVAGDLLTDLGYPLSTDPT